MAQTAREIFIVGLRNAHAMETQARELMERQSERLDEYPEVKTKLTAHLQETNEQRDCSIQIATGALRARRRRQHTGASRGFAEGRGTDGPVGRCQC